MELKFYFALLIPVLAVGCMEDNPAARDISFTIEAGLPEGTPSSDVIYLCGPCFASDQMMAPKYARVRTIELNTKDFVSGKSMEDGFWFESELFGRELDADGAPVTHTLSPAAGLTYSVTVARWTGEPGEDIVPQMLAGKWSIVGSMNEWRLSLGYAMEKSGESSVFKDLNCSGSDSFKLVLDGSWLVNFGYGEPNTTVKVSESRITLVRDGGNIQPAAGMYTLSFNPGTCVLSLSRTGDYIPAPEPDSWSVAERFNGWDKSTSFPLSRQKSGLYTASYIDLHNATAADGGDAGIMLVRNGDSMYGVAGGGTVTPGAETPIQENGARILLPENGYYDFVLNPDNQTVTISRSPDPTLSSWSIVGKFNGWDPAAGIPFYSTGDWYVAKDVELTNVSGSSDMGFKFVKNKSWDNNRGITGLSGGDGGFKVIGLDEEISISQGGGNIQLEEEGSYDIYMNADTDKAYVLKAGTTFLH